MGSAKKCDRCGSYYELGHSSIQLRDPVAYTDYGKGLEPLALKGVIYTCFGIDLCPKCSKAFVTFMENETEVDEDENKTDCYIRSLENEIQWYKEELEEITKVNAAVSKVEEEGDYSYILELAKKAFMEGLEDEKPEAIKRTVVDLLRRALYGNGNGCVRGSANTDRDAGDIERAERKVSSVDKKQ